MMQPHIMFAILAGYGVDSTLQPWRLYKYASLFFGQHQSSQLQQYAAICSTAVSAKNPL